MGQINEYVHLVGLSAILPNDVSAFLHFDTSYRLCGLQQPLIGVIKKKTAKG